MDATTYFETAEEIIETNTFMCLATSDVAGNPWASVVSYCVDDELNFYFQTALDSIHIENLRDNPRASVAIYSSQQEIDLIDGIQMSGVVGQVEEDDVHRVYTMFIKQVIPDEQKRSEIAPPEKIFSSDGFPTLRFFQFLPDAIYKKDLAIQGVARRLELSLDGFRSHWHESR